MLKIRQFPARAGCNGRVIFSGATNVDDRHSAALVLDMLRTDVINPADVVHAISQPEAEEFGLGPGVVSKIVGAHFREIQPGKPLSPEWFSRLLHHPSTAAILTTVSALPTDSTRIKPIYLAARTVAYLDDHDLARIPIAEVAARATQAVKSLPGWGDVVLTDRDIDRALRCRRLWQRPADDSLVRRATEDLASPLRSRDEAETALALHLAALMTKGIPCSCQATKKAPPATIQMNSPVVGCSCRLQPVRIED